MKKIFLLPIISLSIFIFLLINTQAVKAATTVSSPAQQQSGNPDYICGSKGKDGKITPGIDTAIGCIPIQDTNATAAFFLRWALGIGGGIAILLIIFASIIITTSAGDPKKVQGGKELLTAAIAGLVLIIFSTFILRIIGVNILEIF